MTDDRVCGQHILVPCPMCGKSIAHESTHECQLPPEVRAQRDADRALKANQLRMAMGVSEEAKRLAERKERIERQREAIRRGRRP